MMEEEAHFVKLSGIPYSATIADIARFLGGCDIKGGKNNGITITKDESGRHSGKCYVELLSNDDVKFAMKKDKQYMKERWINVEVSSETEKMHDVSQYGVHAGSGGDEEGEGDNIVQCRGLPWRAGPAEISCFFAGCDLKSSKAESIHIIKNPEGRPTGQAFVEFLSGKDLDLALKKHKEYMGHRFVEVISATRKHMETTLSDCKVHDENREPVLYMRGLPFDCTDEDIKEFFKPLEVTKTQIVKNGSGRSIGEAFAEFVSLADSDKGMSKFGQKIGKRYIEIFQSHSKYWCETRDPNKEHHVDNRYHDNRPREWGRYDSRVAPYARDRYGARFRGGGNMRYQQHGGGGNMSSRRAGGGYNRGGGSGGAGGAGMGAEREGYSNFERPPPMHSDGMVKGGPNKHFVIVRGVSVNTSVGDIVKFFSRVVNPKNVELKFDPGSAKGDVIVELHTHADAMKSMLLDKETLGVVEVQLELKSKPEDYADFEPDDAYQSAGANQTYSNSAYQHHFDPYATSSW